ncbi:MAG: glycosyltransferase family 9 protein [Flavobacteriales bacterium]
MSFCYTHKAEHRITSDPSAATLHEVERNHAVIAPFISSSRRNPKIYPSKEDFNFIKGFGDTDFITISPASVWETKKTPLSKWAELVGKYSIKKVYLLGGPSDISICEELKSQVESTSIEILAGKLSLLQSAALMSKAKMNFVNDSGPLHLCSAMNAPVTAVFCSTIPSFGFTPLSDNAKVVEVSEKLNCRPCGLHGHKTCPQGHFKCGNDLNVDLML